MEELYEYMNKKNEEMYKSKDMTVTINFPEFAKLYQMVCYMKQIREIANGCK